MTWTARTWTDRPCAALALGLRVVGQVTADQPVPLRQAGAGDQVAAASAPIGRTPRHPCPPGTPARARACLSAPPHGPRETWGKTGARGKPESPGPGAGEGARA
jgi:hypothetical protein